MHDTHLTPFAREKREVAEMLDALLEKGGLPALITNAEYLADELLVNSNGSANKSSLGRVVQQLTVMDITNLARNLRWLAKHLREGPDEPIEVDTFVQRILRSAKE
ncbi:MAG: hypothetical protein RL681_437 [Candidatus Parcubacteria bacterium]|jgi:hypothetical protein